METLTFFIMMGFAAAVMAWYILNHENDGNGTMGFIGIIVDKIDEQIVSAKKYRSKERVHPAKENLKKGLKERKFLKKGTSKEKLNLHDVQKVKLNYDDGAHNRAQGVKEKLTSIKDLKAEAQRRQAEKREAEKYEADKRETKKREDRKTSTLSLKKDGVIRAYTDDDVLTQVPANDAGYRKRDVEQKSYKPTTRKRFKAKSIATPKNGEQRIKPREKLTKIKIGSGKLGSGKRPH